MRTWGNWIGFCSAQLVFLFTIFYYPVILPFGHYQRVCDGRATRNRVYTSCHGTLKLSCDVSPTFALALAHPNVNHTAQNKIFKQAPTIILGSQLSNAALYLTTIHSITCAASLPKAC